MPLVAAEILGQLNYMFGPENLRKIPRALLKPGADLQEAIKSLGIPLSREAQRFLKAVPPAQQEAIRGALNVAVNSRPRMSVNFAWAPGYDYELRIWEARGTRGARSLTLMILSPHRVGR